MLITFFQSPFYFYLFRNHTPQDYNSNDLIVYNVRKQWPYLLKT